MTSELGGALVAWLVPVFVSTALVLLAAWIVDLALRRRVSARWRMLLFAAVLVRIALPADFATPVGLRIAPVAADSTTTSVATPSSFDWAPPLAESPKAASRDASLRPVAFVPIAWAIGTLAILMVLGVGRIRLARALRGVEPSSLVASAPVMLHDTLGPAVVGVVAPRIVVPRALATTLDAARLAHVLRHESAHVERRDPWTFALVQMVLALAWPVVSAWLAARRMRQLAEEACDERAVAGLDGAGRRAYASTLVELAELMSATRATPALGLLMTGPKVEARVAALRFTHRWPAALQAALVVAACVVAIATLGATRATASAPRRIEVATLAEATGEVLVRLVRTPKWKPAAAGMVLASGDRVWVKEGRARVVYPAGYEQAITDATIVEIMDPPSRAETDPDELEMRVDVQPGPAGTMRIDAAELHRLEWPLRKLTTERAMELVRPLMSLHGNVVVDLRTNLLMVEDSQDRLDVVRALLERDDAGVVGPSGMALVSMRISDVSTDWVAAHADLLPEACSGRDRCQSTLEGSDRRSALLRAIDESAPTLAVPPKNSQLIYVDIGRPGVVTTATQGAAGRDFVIDVLVTPDATGSLELVHHVRWESPLVETRGTVPFGKVHVILVPLGGEHEGRVALVVAEILDDQRPATP